MAFKMKGSPHESGTMEGTSAHKSALKAYKTMKKYGNDAVKFGSTEGKSVPNKMGKDHKTMSYMKSPYEQAKPDYLDMDKDGDKKESMKKAIADKKTPLPQSCPDGSAPVPLDKEGNPLMQMKSPVKDLTTKERSGEEAARRHNKNYQNTGGGEKHQKDMHQIDRSGLKKKKKKLYKKLKK